MPLTAGPWTIVFEENCFPGIDAGHRSIIMVGSMSGDDDGGIRGASADEIRANAALIAAAPDMLRELKAIQSDLDRITQRVTRAVARTAPDARVRGREDN